MTPISIYFLGTFLAFCSICMEYIDINEKDEEVSEEAPIVFLVGTLLSWITVIVLFFKYLIDETHKK